MGMKVLNADDFAKLGFKVLNSKDYQDLNAQTHLNHFLNNVNQNDTAKSVGKSNKDLEETRNRRSRIRPLFPLPWRQFLWGYPHIQQERGISAADTKQEERNEHVPPNADSPEAIQEQQTSQHTDEINFQNTDEVNLGQDDTQEVKIISEDTNETLSGKEEESCEESFQLERWKRGIEIKRKINETVRLKVFIPKESLE